MKVSLSSWHAYFVYKFEYKIKIEHVINYQDRLRDFSQWVLTINIHLWNFHNSINFKYQNFVKKFEHFMKKMYFRSYLFSNCCIFKYLYSRTFVFSNICNCRHLYFRTFDDSNIFIVELLMCRTFDVYCIFAYLYFQTIVIRSFVFSNICIFEH